jgi:hypothetical protein
MNSAWRLGMLIQNKSPHHRSLHPRSRKSLLHDHTSLVLVHPHPVRWSRVCCLQHLRHRYKQMTLQLRRQRWVQRPQAALPLLWRLGDPTLYEDHRHEWLGSYTIYYLLRHACFLFFFYDASYRTDIILTFTSSLVQTVHSLP